MSAFTLPWVDETQQRHPFSGLRTSYEYDWVHKQFVRLPLMAGGGRWYPGATQLGNGDVFVVSGLNGAGALNTQPEVYHHARRTWRVTPYRLSVPTYAHMLPTAGGRLFFTGVGFGGLAVRVGFLSPLTGRFQAVGGLDTNRRDQGASFFVRRCCIWSTGGMPKPCRPRDQIAKASSSNATAKRRATGSSTASS